jgi:hypothetical protein
LTSSSVRSEIDSWLLNTSDRARSAREGGVRLEDMEPASDRLAPARGIVLTAFLGAVLWITLIGFAYFLVERAGL